MVIKEGIEGIKTEKRVARTRTIIPELSDFYLLRATN